MDLLAEYFEHGAPEVIWDEDEHTQKLYNEMEAIYLWWTKEWPHCDERRVDGTVRLAFPELPSEWGTMPALNPKYSDTPEIAAWRNACDAHHHDDNDWTKKEEEMLCRLMKIRTTLWY